MVKFDDICSTKFSSPPEWLNTVTSSNKTEIATFALTESSYRGFSEAEIVNMGWSNWDTKFIVQQRLYEIKAHSTEEL